MGTFPPSLDKSNGKLSLPGPIEILFNCHIYYFHTTNRERWAAIITKIINCFINSIQLTIYIGKLIEIWLTVINSVQSWKLGVIISSNTTTKLCFFWFVLFLGSFLNSCGCSTAKSKASQQEIFFYPLNSTEYYEMVPTIPDHSWWRIGFCSRS